MTDKNTDKKQIDKKTQGKKNRQAGARFELKVRKDLESKGWNVFKNTNNVEFKEYPVGVTSSRGGDGGIDILGKLIPAKRKYNPYKKVMAIGTGFPDFVAFTNKKGFRIDTLETINYFSNEPERYFVIGVEAKSNGYLDKTEKEKCKWLLENNIFSKILIASKSKKRGEIIYKEFLG